MPLSFGASTFSFSRREPALESMRRLRGLGYRVFDVLAVPGHLWHSELDGAARARLRAELERDDIVVDSVNPQPVDLNLGSCLAEVREYSVATYAATIRLAAELGASAVVVVPGRVAPLLPPDPQDTLGWLAESVAALSATAAEAGLPSLLIENHPTSGVPSASAVCALLDRVGAGNVRVAYDVANAEYLGEDQVEAIRAQGSRLGQTHLSDAEPGRVAHDPLGSGTVAFEAILGELDAAGFAGVNVVEIVSATDPVGAYRAAARVLGI